MQFHFPQYIDIEDKIFGPLTLKQAIFVAGGAGGAYVVFTYVPYAFISIPLIVGIGVLTWALAFYPKEKLGRPFTEIMEAGFNYYRRDKLYTWKKTTVEPSLGKEEQFLSSKAAATPIVSTGKLASSSFALDVKGPEGETEREDEVLPAFSLNSKRGLSVAASAEAGALSQESFVLGQKIPRVNTFVAPERAEHTPYKSAPAQGAGSGVRTGAATAMTSHMMGKK